MQFQSDLLGSPVAALRAGLERKLIVVPTELPR
jgi:hypothetical protein